MEAVVFRAHGGPEALRWEDVPRPRPAAGEVLLRVRAVALNGFDPMVLKGIPQLPIPLPMIPCADCAAEIVALGDDVDRERWRVGQRVSVMPIRPGRGMVGETLPGVAAAFATAPEAALLPLPDAVDDVAAACLPTAYGTAMRMLFTRARVRRGERVLVMGASGGVGVACVQLASRAGAEVIACARGAGALSRLPALGAAATIDAEREDVLSEVLGRVGKPSVWGGGGVDVVVDVLGGEGWARSLACLGRGGRLVTCGASAGPDVAMDLRYVWSLEIDVMGSNGWTLEDQEALVDMVARGELAPVVHAVRPMTEARAAYSELIGGCVVGKSVLVPPA